MGVFLDTSFLIAYYNISDRNHDVALKIIEKIKNEDYGYVYTSDYVLDEFFTYMQKRHTNPEYCYELAEAWMNQNAGIAELLEVGYTIFYKSTQLFITQQQERKPLSLTDCTIVTICDSNDIQYLVTFDHGFDGHIELVRI